MNPGSFLPAAAALVAGAIIAVQPGFNGLLAKRLDHPIQASLISFAVGLAILVAACVLLGQRLPRPSMLGGVPWWMWLCGGMVGALFVTTALVVAPRVGAAYWIALVVAGQMLASLLLDHHGVLGFAQREVTAPRLLGAGLIVAGVVLISWRSR